MNIVGTNDLETAAKKETRNEVLITHDFPNAGGTQLSPLIMPNLTQTRDELSSNRNSPIARSSSAFEKETQNEVLITHDLPNAGGTQLS
ncbi:unnamed protein product [Eruca vesicaria subsp. sativa]|uniref:Uncharacterized protein n=1 Tax=Eruca vesicaria subsp. sativa TaxID=29727 RepID=A0ABC8M0R9_ERUVS|nr:unnamed protein product [Eruca vesicaria subsp. sativa]